MLVLRPGALGDTLLAVPALRALRRLYPEPEPLTLAAHAGAARLLEQLGEVTHGLAFDDPSLGWVFNGPPPDERVVAWMRSADDLPGLRRALVVAPSRPPDNRVHCAQYLLETLAPLGCPDVVDQRPLGVEPLASAEVLVAPGSGSLRKNWPAELYAAVIRLLDAVPVRLVVGEADAEAAAAVESSLGRRLPRLERPELLELARRLAGCRGYLGNDSGVSQLAGLCGTRTVVLFGPTAPEVWRPLGPSTKVFGFAAEPGQVAEAVMG